MINKKGASEAAISFVTGWAPNTIRTKVSFLRRYASIQWHWKGSNRVYKAFTSNSISYQRR
jgi:hypothetical protein